MKLRLALPAACCLLALAATAAPALAPALQRELDAAVADYDAGRLAPAQAAFEALARRQVPAAEFDLALMHLHGEVPVPDRARARRLLERAAAGGFVTAQLMLGQALESGTFGPRELSLAHDWYERAARAGSVDAQVAMGTAYFLGRGRPKDPVQAAQWYRQAATAGDVGAQYLLASMYEHGDGVALDLRLARNWYAAAAAQGDVLARDKVREIDARLAAVPS
ncbi:MAG: sel1 repeat family protein [Burkholderiales bacterium]|nr:sel1 repeat family protein [Burkholderiales bacterium]MDE2160980.1 sel1 repeat family protein [Burkholderiales bacterium]MDE2503165.1 sel1 repeat family protein [Burkholderiales bacterium]